VYGCPTVRIQELTELHVVGIRYRNSSYAPGDERALDAYAGSGVYHESLVPVTVVEPRLDDGERWGIESRDIGILCGTIADAVAAGRAAGRAVLVVGGNCVHATGVLGGLQDAHGPSARVGLIWLDAHGDFNTPLTSESGSLGGMPVAVAVGLAHQEWRELSHVKCPLPAYRVVLAGTRDVDDAERRLIRAAGVVTAACTPYGEGADLERSIAFVEERCDQIYLHIDCDVLDESHVPNHRSRVSDGPDPAGVLEVVDRVMKSGKVTVLAVVSVSGVGPGQVSVHSGIELIGGGLRSWREHGLPDVPLA
jgi:arginase